jgi:DNA gyrase subunit B
MDDHATFIKVTLHEDGTTLSVEDNGRGIPVDIHKKTGRSALEVIFTTLHAGGKFDGNSYKTAGGLHGVGSSVVNALSIALEARVRRDGHEYLQNYKRGRPRKDVEVVGPARGTGTRITFTPDPEIFADTTYDAETIKERLEVKTFLNKGLKITFFDKLHGRTHEIVHDGGLADYLSVLCKRDGLNSVLEVPFTHDKDNGIRLDVALTWTDSPREKIRTFVNGIPTRDGGTHEQGFKDGLVKALRSFMDAHSLAPRSLTLTSDDLREGLVTIVSLFIAEPQFQGQTKDRLNNPEIRGAVDASLRPALEQWLHNNKSVGETIIHRAVQAARARIASRQAVATVRAKTASSARLSLPGKLADCSSRDPSARELFIVEGDSAGGSAKQGRDRKTQAILPLRGKVLNCEQATLKKVLGNEELKNIITALGCGIGKDFREDRLRYNRIILLMDADSDGHHIATLLLTFFYRYLPELIRLGYVYIAQPPLFRINVGKDTHWALTDAHRNRILKKLPSRAKPEITRFKGLGEMPPKTLFQTTLDPKRRRLQQVTLSMPMEAENTISELMGKDPSFRYRFIIDNADDVDELDV